jgi:hypothetical protein
MDYNAALWNVPKCECSIYYQNIQFAKENTEWREGNYYISQQIAKGQNAVKALYATWRLYRSENTVLLRHNEIDASGYNGWHKLAILWYNWFIKYKDQRKRQLYLWGDSGTSKSTFVYEVLLSN